MRISVFSSPRGTPTWKARASPSTGTGHVQRSVEEKTPLSEGFLLRCCYRDTYINEPEIPTLTTRL